ncbi:unnamed protein product [Closterium sp. NIES-53]
MQTVGLHQQFTLPDSPQQNGIAEPRIGLVMEVARTSMIHAAAPNFLWPFAVRYAAHQLNLWARVSLPKTSPTLCWTGKVGDASVLRVWGSHAFVRDPSTDKLFAPAILCVFLGFVPDVPFWQFYDPNSRSVLPSQDVTFDESVPFYHPPLGAVPGEVAVDSGTARGTASEGAELGVAGPGGAEPRGAETGGAEPGGVETGGAEPGGAELEGVGPGGTASEGAASSGGPSALRLPVLHATAHSSVYQPLALSSTFGSVPAAAVLLLARNADQRHVASCPTCQLMKSSRKRPAGQLQPLPPPERAWQQVTVDFVTGLPAGASGINAILVVVDRLTKMAHFITCKKSITAEETARLFISTIVRLHGIPASISSDGDTNFTSNFWRNLWQQFGTRLQFSSSNHPETDGQTEWTNQTME